MRRVPETQCLSAPPPLPTESQMDTHRVALVLGRGALVALKIRSMSVLEHNCSTGVSLKPSKRGIPTATLASLMSVANTISQTGVSPEDGALPRTAPGPGRFVTEPPFGIASVDPCESISNPRPLRNDTAGRAPDTGLAEHRTMRLVRRLFQGLMIVSTKWQRALGTAVRLLFRGTVTSLTKKRFNFV